MRHFAGVVFAIAAFLLLMVCIPRTGAIYTHDSQAYEYAAGTLIDSGEIKYFGYDTPIIQWPPFYIFIAAIIKLLGIPFSQGAAWVNALAFAYLIYAASEYLFDTLNVKWLAVPAVFMMMVSIPLIFISGYAWTDMLFIFLSVLSMILMLEYIKRDSIGWLVCSAVSSALCWLTRYIGIVIIAVLAFMLFVCVNSFREKIKKTFLYMVFSCFPMALWVLRNYIYSGTFTGGRQPGIYTIEDNIRFSLEVFNGWSSYYNPLFTWISAAFFVFLAFLALSLKKSTKKKKGSPDIFAFLFFLVLYSAVLLVSATKTAMDPLDDRLWSPVFPFWIITLVLVFDRLLKNIKADKAKNWIAVGFTMFAVISLINPIVWVKEEGLARKDALLGAKESLQARQSELLKLAQESIVPDSDVLIISNKAHELTMHTSLKCYYPPKKNSIPLYSYNQYSERMENFREVYLAWLGDPISESFMDIPEFREKYDLKLIAQNNNCYIFKLNSLKQD